MNIAPTPSLLAWFQNARFGLFIHWGLYAVPGGIWRGQEMDYIGEWLQARFRIPNADYAGIAKDFDPVGFDARAWVRAAKAAGMRYLVFTAKHHDGFAMYHSPVSPFNIVDATPFGRDPLAELAAACREEGLKLGLYYSQDLDWSHPYGGDPGPDFPKNYGMSWGNDWDFPDHSTKSFVRYFEEKALPQVEELLTRYGDIALLWFDTPVSMPPECSARLVRRVKELQPACLINTRVGHGHGDYGSLGDNQVPAARRAGAWECPGTLNDTWGFKWTDQAWKTPAEVVDLLASLAAKDTNYLLNVGPRPNGTFPEASTQILATVGEWLDAHPGIIHGTTGNPFPADFDWGHLTVTPGTAGRPTRLNFILAPGTVGETRLAGLRETVLRVFDPCESGRDLPFEQASPDADLAELTLPPPPALPAGDALAGLPRVLCAELATSNAPSVDERLIPQNGALRLLAGRAEILRGDGVTGEAVGKVGTDGTLVLDEGRAELRHGLWIDGHLGGDALTWCAWLFQPGRYEVEILSVVRHHGAAWRDGQMVRLTIKSGGGTHTQELILRGAERPSAGGKCFPEGVSPAGAFVLEQPGEVRITLHVLTPPEGDPHAIGIKEISVRASRVSPSIPGHIEAVKDLG